jgi:A2L zinc ribbon protein
MTRTCTKCGLPMMLREDGHSVCIPCGNFAAQRPHRRPTSPLQLGQCEVCKASCAVRTCTDSAGVEYDFCTDCAADVLTEVFDTLGPKSVRNHIVDMHVKMSS